MDAYESRQLPLDVFVLDMDWHKKNDWSGFTFDDELFPFPEDSMAGIKRKVRACATTLQLHGLAGRALLTRPPF